MLLKTKDDLICILICYLVNSYCSHRLSRYNPKRKKYILNMRLFPCLNYHSSTDGLERFVNVEIETIYLFLILGKVILKLVQVKIKTWQKSAYKTQMV